MFSKTDPQKEAIKKQQMIINKLLKKPENKFCADCKTSPPSWASMNLGVFVCIKCSGCHRELGAHISKIKSINLDTWPIDALENFKKINNEIAKKYWEYNLKNFNFEIIKNDRTKRMEFIKNKYEYKKWVNPNEIDPMSKIITDYNFTFNPNYNNGDNNFDFNNNFNNGFDFNNNFNNFSFNNQNNFNNNFQGNYDYNFYYNGIKNFNSKSNTQSHNNNSNSFYNSNFNNPVKNDNNSKNKNNIYNNKKETSDFNWNYFNQNN